SLFGRLWDAPLNGGPGRHLDGSPGLVDLRRDDRSVAASIAVEPGCIRTPTPANASGPGYWPCVRVRSISNHRSMRTYVARPSSARRPTGADSGDKLGDGPAPRSRCRHSLNRMEMACDEPVASRRAPVHPLKWIAPKHVRPDFLGAGLSEQRLKVPLRCSIH